MIGTVRQTAKKKEVPERFLRSLRAQGKCPGFYSGTRFYIHQEKFEALLDEMSTVKEDA